ncbi:MAG: purine-nucleoside phosphorylase [Anaerolineales bacterium]|nr:purine-nucleoside phosphorylase [Anaerolineales bacterium]
MSNLQEQINAARDYIQARTKIKPEIALVLGSGLGGLVDEIEIDAEFPYNEIPNFHVSTVHGHAGKLVLGKLFGREVVVMQGRLHYYEGHPMTAVIFPTRVMHALGAETFVVTNAAGGLNPEFRPGDVMLISDHINMMGTNALIGPNEESIGPRFPDMTHTYTPELQQLALRVAEQEQVALQQGVYVAWSGPTFETPAERRFLRIIGGDAVGMSTVPEVTAARHAGMRILGFSAITNVATGAADQPPDDHLEVLEVALVAGKKLVRLLRAILQA